LHKNQAGGGGTFIPSGISIKENMDREGQKTGGGKKTSLTELTGGQKRSSPLLRIDRAAKGEPKKRQRRNNSK